MLMCVCVSVCLCLCVYLCVRARVRARMRVCVYWPMAVRSCAQAGVSPCWELAPIPCADYLPLMLRFIKARLPLASTLLKKDKSVLCKLHCVALALPEQHIMVGCDLFLGSCLSLSGGETGHVDARLFTR